MGGDAGLIQPFVRSARIGANVRRGEFPALAPLAHGDHHLRVLKHLQVLEEADLVIPVRKGRERWNHLNPLPIHDIHERWVGPHAAHATAKLAKLKRDLERN